MSTISSFNTQDVHPWDKPQLQTSKNISFAQTYVAPPRLAVGLNHLDIKCGTNLRVHAYVDGIEKQKYTAHIDSWGNTTLYSAGIDALVLKPANLDILTGEFSTEEDHPWNQPKPQTSRRINFERPFVTPPKVVVYFKGFETGGGTSTRLRTYTSDIDCNGFTVHIDTWGNTTLYSAIAGWVAYPEDKSYIYSGTSNTGEDHPWQNPQPETHRDISFGGTDFLKEPSVFVAFNTIDCGTGENLRARTYVDKVTLDGMTWHINSWGDTKMWTGGISYIVFN